MIKTFFEDCLKLFTIFATLKAGTKLTFEMEKKIVAQLREIANKYFTCIDNNCDDNTKKLISEFQNGKPEDKDKYAIMLVANILLKICMSGLNMVDPVRSGLLDRANDNVRIIGLAKQKAYLAKDINTMYNFTLHECYCLNILRDVDAIQQVISAKQNLDNIKKEVEEYLK